MTLAVGESELTSPHDIFTCVYACAVDTALSLRP
jgi:hypothetical protein